MDDLDELTEISRLHGRWFEALGVVREAVLDSHSRDPIAGCKSHGGKPAPSCGNCFLSDWGLNRMGKSVMVMRGQGVTMRKLEAQDSHYRLVVLELARITDKR